MTPTASLLEQNQLVSVSQLTVVVIAPAGNKAVKTGKPAWLSRQLVPCQSTRTGKHNMVVPRVRTNLRQESLAVKAIKAYNHLSPEIKSLESLPFQKEVKKWCKHTIPLKLLPSRSRAVEQCSPAVLQSCLQPSLPASSLLLSP